VFSEKLQFVWREKEKARGERGEEHHNEHGKDAADAPHVEVNDVDAAQRRVAEEAAVEDAGNEKARDDKEDVNSDETAAQAMRKGVIDDDRKDGDGAKSVNVRTVISYFPFVFSRLRGGAVLSYSLMGKEFLPQKARAAIIGAACPQTDVKLRRAGDGERR